MACLAIKLMKDLKVLEEKHEENKTITESQHCKKGCKVASSCKVMERLCLQYPSILSNKHLSPLGSAKIFLRFSWILAVSALGVKHIETQFFPQWEYRILG